MKGKKAAIISNVGFYWPFAPVRSRGLSNIETKYKDEGLSVIGFPCDQFQRADELEHYTNQQIISEFDSRLHVSFKLMDQCKVNGLEAHPVF